MPRVRLDGGLIGVTNNPSSASAGGMWSFSEHQKYTRSSGWPAASPPAGSVNATALIVAGGGGGGHDFGGGGGAGGLISNTVTLINILNYTITVGAGGAGPTSYGALPSVGSNTTAFGYTAVGGGGGAGTATPGYNATSGGSGGGAAGNGGPGTRGLGTAGQGNDGGTATGAAGSSTASGGGGGGGAGAAGTNATRAQAGNGGAGIYSSISGSNTAYAGGGGGGGYSPYTALAGTGGAGGGGSGNTSSNGSGAPGTAYTGGGGGGGAGGGTGTNSAASGGSGIAIVNYPAPQQYTGGTVTNVNNLAGSNIVHTFYTSGSLNALATPIDTYFNYNTLLLHGDGTSGANNSVFLDSSTNNLSITKSGTPTQGTFSPFATTGWSYYNGGSSPYIAPQVGAVTLSGDFTIEGWFYDLGLTAYSTPFGWRASAGTTGLFVQRNNSTNVLNLAIGNGTLNTYTPSTSAYTMNAWHHIAVTRSGTTVTLWIDGFSQVTTTLSGAISIPSNTLYLGADPGNLISTVYFYGYVSNFRVINGNSLYNNTFIPPSTSLTNVANTILLTAQSNQFIGSNTTVSNVSITTAGTPQVQQFTPFSPTAVYSNTAVGGSVYFPGANTSYLSTPNFAVGSGDFTVEAWVYLTVNQNSTIFCNTFRLELTSSTTISVINNGVAYIINAATVPNLLNRWAHVAVSRSGTNLRLFVDGNLITTATDSTNFTSNTTRVGLEAGSGINPFAGFISNLRVVPGSALYTTAFTPSTTPLTAVTNTQLLLGANNAGIIDSSQKNEFITYGTAALSSTQSKFGGTSIYLDGSSYIATVNPGAQYVFATGNWTIEAWVYPTSTATTQTVYQVYGNTNDNINIQFNGTSLAFFADIRATNQVLVTATSSVAATLNAWNHIALVRDSATTVKLYVNGSLGATATIGSTTTFVDTQFTGNPSIGAKTNPVANYFTGYVDDLRVTKGIARYTTAFTPPTTAFLNQ